jgi:hypothetical protein
MGNWIEPRSLLLHDRLLGLFVDSLLIQKRLPSQRFFLYKRLGRQRRTLLPKQLRREMLRE